MGEIDIETLRTSIDAAQARMQEIEAQIEPLRKQLEDARSEVEALETLLALKDPTFERRARRQPRVASPVARRPTALADKAYEVLKEENRPIHYSELYQLLVSRGVDIPGKNPAANLIGHISPDPRFRRTSRGTYELAERNT